ncbi:SUKH-4 family immunity protein [Streptomyces sp. NPDC087420]|uniref:SUKH-4 family immunity protein n=1 Tax=Streptomyces sp. NPDC087420 TaxID=3365785 RepID=UPI003832EADE
MNSGNSDAPIFRTVLLSARGENGGGDSFSVEVPAQSLGQAYRASQKLEEVRIDGVRYYDFGSTGIFGRVVLDPDSGRVMEVGKDRTGATLVNSTIEKFSECVQGFIGRFPFYSADEEDRWEVVAREVEEMIQGIDPAAFFEGGYWYEIRWAVAIGDFATEELE